MIAPGAALDSITLTIGTSGTIGMTKPDLKIEISRLSSHAEAFCLSQTSQIPLSVNAGVTAGTLNKTVCRGRFGQIGRKFCGADRSFDPCPGRVEYGSRQRPDRSECTPP